MEITQSCIKHSKYVESIEYCPIHQKRGLNAWKKKTKTQIQIQSASLFHRWFSTCTNSQNSIP